MRQSPSDWEGAISGCDEIGMRLAVLNTQTKYEEAVTYINQVRYVQSQALEKLRTSIIDFF